MDTKITPAPSLSLFKETKIGNECVPGQIIIQLKLPSSANLRSLPNFNRNSRPQRHVLKKKPSCPGEEEFARSVLSCAGSIHFGTAGRYPRSIAWRTLQNKKVLELRSVDLSKSDGEKREATIVIQLAFSNAIWDGGVALADPEDQDFLNVFVLTKDSELYTLTINRDFFCHAIASEEEIVRWYKIFKPSSFSMGIPHRLIAVNSLQLAVSLGNGKLLILKRSLRDDGSIWHETTYGGGGWASNFGSLIRWQGGKTIKYDGCSLDLDTATALALSPDGKHVWAVCLNHTFKVWSLDTAVSVFSLDLLGQTREPHEMRKVALDPNILHTLQVFQTESKTGGDEYYVMTFSPIGLGQFKIWGIRDPNEASRGIRDIFPEYVLPPPDPDPSPESKAIWKVADFQVNSAEKGKGMEIWVLMRSNKQYRLYSLTFGLEDLANQWQDSWLQTTLEMPDRHIQPSILDSGPEDVTDLWLKLLLYPGRYPETVLETALSMYSSARKVDIPSKHNSSYVQRVCGAVTSHIRLQQNGADMDFQKYREDLNQEWSLLWQDVRDLNNSRWGVLSLGFDKTTDIAWITFADGHSVIRECSRIEVLAHNTPWDLAQSMNLLETPSVEVGGEPREPKLPDELAVLVEAATKFRQTFGDPLRQKFNLVVTSELWQEPSSSVLDRMQSFYDKFNFAEEIRDIEISALEAGLESIGGYNGLETSSFLAIIDELPQVMLAEVSGLVSTCFGLKVLVEGARQMINLYERVLVDLLVMVVFISTEVDGDEYALKFFDGEKLYVIILEQLKRYQMMQWLARNIRSQTVAVVDDRTIVGQASDQLPSDANHNGPSTVLENLFAIDVKPQEHSLQSQSAALTHSMQDILKWVTGGNEPTITLDIVLVHVQCSLLVNRNLDLALDFLCFQPSTAWATYIKGRLYLLRGEYTEASFHFKRAAYKLCKL